MHITVVSMTAPRNNNTVPIRRPNSSASVVHVAEMGDHLCELREEETRRSTGP